MWKKGPLTMLLGFVLMGAVPVMVKGAKLVGWGAGHTVFVRFVFACVGLLVLASAGAGSLLPNNWRYWVMRGVFGSTAVLLYFHAVQLAGAGPGTLLNYTYPVWANLFAVLFWRQRVPAAFWGLLVVALVGVYLVVDPRLGGVQLGEVLGVCSAVFAGAAVLCIKKLRETDSTLSVVGSFSLIGMLMALPVAVVETQASELSLPWSDPRGWGLLLAVGGFSLLGHLFFTRAYKHTSLQLGSMLALSVPVLAAFSGWLVLDEPLTSQFLTGGALILAASGLLAHLETRRAAPE